MIDRDPLHLYPAFAMQVGKLLAKWNAENPKYTAAVLEGLRSLERQAELYAKGRTVPGPKVTNAPPGMSWHNYGLAVDIVFDADPVRPGPQWTWSGEYPWPKLGRMAYDFGLEWAGTWRRFQEWPHFQNTFGLQLVEAHTLYQDGGIKAVWNELQPTGSMG